MSFFLNLDISGQTRTFQDIPYEIFHNTGPGNFNKSRVNTAASGLYAGK